MCDPISAIAGAFAGHKANDKKKDMQAQANAQAKQAEEQALAKKRIAENTGDAGGGGKAGTEALNTDTTGDSIRRKSRGRSGLVIPTNVSSSTRGGTGLNI